MSYVSQFVPVVNIWDGFTEAMTVEGLHPNILGADFISLRVVPIITANFEFPAFRCRRTLATFTRPSARSAASMPTRCWRALAVLPAGVNAAAGSVLADGYKALGSGLAGITTRWFEEPAAYGEARCIELRGKMAAAGGYIYMQPTANVIQTNLAAGDVIEMVSAVEIMGSSRGILAWEAELTITKTVSGASSTFYYRSMDKYQEPFTMPASFAGALETQRGTID
nr:SGNH/GDSL hydrolase family protein [Pseudomonas syringae]